jgi:chemotaxis protein CheX
MKRVLSEVLALLAPEALVDVFASYGVRLEEQAAPSPPVRNRSIVPKAKVGDPIAAGVIGFTGADLRGTLLIATTFEIIARARPDELQKRLLSKDSAADWIMVRDWVGELTNQVLGRIKNRLRPHGVSFDVSPPTALSGPALTFAAPKGPSPQHHVFTHGGQTVWFCFDAFFDLLREFPSSGGEPEPSEGKIILFE